MLLKKLVLKNRGNISFLTIAVLVIFLILFVVILDLCQIFIAREETKKASDSASLAVAQNLLFFDNEGCCEIAREVAELNNCTMAGCGFDYDEVMVRVEKNVRFIILDNLIEGKSTITSTSKAKVLYPWDEHFNYCDYYEFNY